MMTEITEFSNAEIAFAPRKIGNLLIEQLARMKRRMELGGGVSNVMPSDPVERFDWIRRKYEFAAKVGESLSPYFMDGVKHFTPIERAAWGYMRDIGVRMHPQYPIGPYFADFADPQKQIVVECDGREFHQDKERDARRDAFMGAQGWLVFRLTGSECMRDEIDWAEVDDTFNDQGADAAERMVAQWLSSTGEGVIAAIGHAFYGRPVAYVSDDVVRFALRSHCPQARGVRALQRGG